MRNKKNKSRRILSEFMGNPSDCFAIFQVDYDNENFPDRAKRIFSGMAEIKNLGIPLPSAEQYQTVYYGTLPFNTWKKENVTSLLDNLYEVFNCKIPDDYTGHSMSVSDVVAIKIQGEIVFYFVDCVGFVELTDFVNEGWNVDWLLDEKLETCVLVDPCDPAHEIHGLFSSARIRPDDVPEGLSLCYACGGENLSLYKSVEEMPGTCSGSLLFREDFTPGPDNREVCTAALPKGSTEFWFTGKKISVREFLDLTEKKLEKL